MSEHIRNTENLISFFYFLFLDLCVSPGLIQGFIIHKYFFFIQKDLVDNPL